MMRMIIEFVETQLEALAPRDKKLLAGMMLFFGFLFVGGLWWTLYGALDTKAQAVKETKGHLKEVIREAASMSGAQVRIAQAETRLNRYKGQRLSAYLEKEAAKNTITELRSVKEVNSETVGSVKQTTYTVDIKKVPYDAYFNFLHDIESSGYPLRVLKSNMKATKKKRDKVLDVTMEIIVYTVAESP